MTIELRDAGYGDAVTAPLLAELQEEMTRRYGGPDQTAVDQAEFAAPGAASWSRRWPAR